MGRFSTKCAIFEELQHKCRKLLKQVYFHNCTHQSKKVIVSLYVCLPYMMVPNNQVKYTCRLQVFESAVFKDLPIVACTLQFQDLRVHQIQQFELSQIQPFGLSQIQPFGLSQIQQFGLSQIQQS